MRTILLLLLVSISLNMRAQEVVELYHDAIPNAKGYNTTTPFIGDPGLIRKVYRPSLEIYMPDKDKATGAGVIICPGGGYGVIVFQGEGVMTAKELAKNGIAAFVLKYRLPDDSLELDKKIAPLQDAQQAIKMVREKAVEWGIDPNKIGIMGFSAGGHLASTAATHFNKGLIDNNNNTSLRPDFQIVVYPVISMQDNLTHLDSRNNLMGKNPSKETIDWFSNEMQVNENTPQAYITHAADDKLVDVDNSINYFEALRKHNVPVEMHIYPKGGHGFIFGRKGWIDPLILWLKDIK